MSKIRKSLFDFISECWKQKNKQQTRFLVYLDRFGLFSYASLAVFIKTSSPIDECDVSELWSSSWWWILVFCSVDLWIIGFSLIGDDRWYVVLVRLWLFICDLYWSNEFNKSRIESNDLLNE